MPHSFTFDCVRLAVDVGADDGLELVRVAVLAAAFRICGCRRFGRALSAGAARRCDRQESSEIIVEFAPRRARVTVI